MVWSNGAFGIGFIAGVAVVGILTVWVLGWHALVQRAKWRKARQRWRYTSAPRHRRGPQAVKP